MKVTYNEEEKIVEIKDRLKTSYFMLRIILLLNILNASINLYNMNDRELDGIGFIWVFVGILSAGILTYGLLKKTTLEKIPLNQIQRLKEKQFFGKKRFSLELKNGKTRDLIKIDSQADITVLKHMFSEIGIY